MSGLPPLIPYQSEWLEDWSRVAIWEKSRRIGASYVDALKSAMLASKKREHGGMNCYYLSYNKDMTKQYIRDCADWTKKINQVASEVEELVIKDQDRDITIYQIRYASGNVIQALPSEARNLRSKQGRVIIDEAAFVDDLQELLKAALALLMWGGYVAVMSTHNGDDNPFSELIKDVRAGRKNYSLHRTDFDEALAQGLYKAICRAQGKDWSAEAEAKFRAALIEDYGDGAEEELFCIPSKGTGVFLTRALIESCLSRDIPVVRWAKDSDFALKSASVRSSEAEAWCEDHLKALLQHLEGQSYLGEDFGRNGDLSVFWPLVSFRGRYIAPFVLELRNIPFQQQEQVLYYILDRLPLFRHGSFDARGNGQYLAEVAMQRYGPDRINQVMISERWYRENMPPLKSAFEDKSILGPYDEDIINDLRSFKVVKGVAKIPEAKTQSRSGQRHGDAGIAAAMAWASTRAEVGAMPLVVSAGRRSMSRELHGY